MAVEYPVSIPDLLARFGINPLDFTNYTDLLRELQEAFDVLGPNPQGGQATVGNRFIAVENAIASPAKLVITGNSGVIQNTAVETAFSNGSYTVFGNTALPGTVFRIQAGGQVNATNSPTTTTLGFTIRWGNGNTDPNPFNCGPTTAMPVVSVGGWWLDAVLTIRTIGGTGSIIAAGMAAVQGIGTGGIGGVIMPVGNTTPITINTTTDKLLTLFAKFSTAHTLNSITLTNFVVEQVH